MKLFHISQSESQMVLSLQRAPQLARLALSTVGVMFIGFLLQDMLGTGPDAWFGSVAFGSLFLYCVFQAGRQLIRTVGGTVWIFDRENDQVLHNNKLVSGLKEIQFVRVWEDAEGEGPLTRHFALVDANGKQFVMSDAISAKEWKQLVEAAEKISAFTGIQLLQA